ncbi:hypothetical protein D3C76_1538170 [compost metagenome]
MLHRHGAQCHQRHGGGQVGAFSELNRLLIGVGADDAAAQIQHRAFGLIDHRGGLRHGGSFKGWRRIGNGDRRQFVQADNRRLNIFRYVDPHRARAAGFSDAECVTDHLRQFADIAA